MYKTIQSFIITGNFICALSIIMWSNQMSNYFVTASIHYREMSKYKTKCQSHRWTVFELHWTVSSVMWKGVLHPTTTLPVPLAPPPTLLLSTPPTLPTPPPPPTLPLPPPPTHYYYLHHQCRTESAGWLTSPPPPPPQPPTPSPSPTPWWPRTANTANGNLMFRKPS